MSETLHEGRVLPSEELSQVKVLYVEDEAVIRESLAKLLRRYLPNFIIATNGEEGLARFKEELPEIVLTDIRMPKLDGLEMSKEIKRIAPNTQIVVMTAFSDSEYLLKAIEIGLNGYLVKPISRDNLVKLLNNAARFVVAQRSKERFNRYTQQILDFQKNLIVVFDKNFILKRANKSFLDYFGCECIEDFIRRFGSLSKVAILESEEGEFNQEFLELVISDVGHTHTITFEGDPKGQGRFFAVGTSKLLMDLKWEGEYIASFTDITSFREENQKLQLQATTDTLTGIDNRFKFQEITEEWRAEGNDYSVIYFDIDHFKHINDQYGHDKGDEILSDLACLVRALLRGEDIFARLGGEEFIILLKNTTLERASEVAERIRHLVELHPFALDRCVTCSFGVAKSQNGETPEETIKRADSAMYIAKRSGRNRIQTA
ncbi:MAG: diguanylate cyclase [Wolinella sp.]